MDIGNGVNFERVRRVTGYLGTLDRFNKAKQAEVRDRVKHGNIVLYDRETYIAAYHWFGWKLAKAERLYDEGARYNNLVAEYLRHTMGG